MFKNTTDATVYTKHYLATVELDDYNVKIDEQNFFDQPVKTTLRIYVYTTWHNGKIATSQRDHYTTSCLLH